jgi:hypothetical protein
MKNKAFSEAVHDLLNVCKSNFSDLVDYLSSATLGPKEITHLGFIFVGIGFLYMGGNLVVKHYEVKSLKVH